MKPDFEDAVVVVTGASTGLGRAIAQEVADRGAKAVVINYASSQKEAEKTGALVSAKGATPILVQGDVGSDEACRAVAKAAEPYGRIDALFNNAGVTMFAGHANMDAVSAEDFLRLYTVNVVGAFQMIRASRALLEAADGVGAVVNTASIAGVAGNGSSVPYAASKGALVTMTVSLARALAPKIRINAICPGFIDTPWFEKALAPDVLENVRQRTLASTPLKTIATVEEIVGAAVFLASPAARHITGETLLVDGGSHLNLTPLGMR